MSKKTKKTIAAVGLSFLIGFQPLTVYATPNERQELMNHYENIEQRIAILEQQIQQKDAVIIEKMNELAKVEVELLKKKVKYEEAKREAELAEKEFHAWLEHTKERVRLMHEQKLDVSILEMILSSKGFSDFVRNMTVFVMLVNHDQSVFDELKKKEEELERAKERFKQEYESLEEMKQKMKKEKESIEPVKRSIEDQLKELERERERISEQLVRWNVEGNVETEEDENEHFDEQFVLDTSNDIEYVSLNRNINKLLQVAYKQLGTPYVWGGTSPKGFDCSGFLQYVYRHIGISLPRTTKEQQRTGVSISKKHIRPGDLVFLGNPAYHVGMYVGGGKYIHAPRTGDVVKVSKIRWSEVSTIKRVLPAPSTKS